MPVKFKPFSINLGGNLLDADRPLVMGIINATPDSFYAGSRATAEADIESRTRRLIAEGADILDLGAYSSRPGADDVSAAKEIDRLETAMRAIRRVSGDIPVSVDTFRADVAEAAVTHMGVDIINDISGGDLDSRMADTVARLKVPYIMMHMRGTPSTMQSLCDYPQGVAAGVVKELSAKVNRLTLAGIADIILDPGFGFAKTLRQNYELLDALPHIMDIFKLPLLIGVSRKSMLTRLLGISADEALEATSALHLAALERGASILRVHDVKAARQAVDIAGMLADPVNYQPFTNALQSC